MWRRSQRQCSGAVPAIYVKSLHAKIGALTLTKAGLLSANCSRNVLSG